jgi:hypothetical protein
MLQNKFKSFFKSAAALLCFGAGMLMLSGCPNTGGSNSPPDKAEYLYTVNSQSNDISMFEGIQSTGKITFIGKVSAGKGPLSLTAVNYGIKGAYVFVANADDSTIGIYSILPSGVLKLKGTVRTASRPTRIIYTGFLVDVICDNTLVGYGFDPATATLQERSRITLNYHPIDLSALFDEPQHKVASVYVLDQLGMRLYCYTQTEAGAITPSAKTPYVQTGAGAVSVKSSFLTSSLGVKMVLETDQQKLDEFTGDAVTGLTLFKRNTVSLNSTHFIPDNTGDPQVITTEFVGGTNVLGQYGVNKSTGALTKHSGANEPAGSLVNDLNYDSALGTVFVVNGSGQLRTYRFQPTGTLKFDKIIDTNGTNPKQIAFTGSFDIYVPQPLVITSTLANARVGMGYEAHLVAEGGRLGLADTWTVSEGTLPPGLTITTDAQGNASITGNPTTAGTYTFTLKATETAATASKQFTIVVTQQGGTFQIITTSLPGGTVAQGYIAPVQVAGGDGTQNATWTVSGGALPPGLQLGLGTSGEAVFGTPTTEGTYAFALKATQGSLNATRAYTLVIAPAATTYGYFLNMSTDPNNNPLQLALQSKVFANRTFGSISLPQQMRPAADVLYTLSNNVPDFWNGHAAVTAGDWNVFVALGSNMAGRKLAQVPVAPDFPGTLAGGIIFLNGLDAITTNVDAYLIDSNGNQVDHKSNVAYGSFANFTVTPDSYTVKVTEAGNAAKVLRTSPKINVARGELYISTPLSGSAPFDDVRVPAPGSN